MSACAVRTKEIGGLALLGERYRRFGRSACCGGVLSSKGRGSVKCKARALGTIALLKRLSLAALGIDPKLSRRAGPLIRCPSRRSTARSASAPSTTGAAAVQHNARGARALTLRTPNAPSTGATITMDGGVADTTPYTDR